MYLKFLHICFELALKCTKEVAMFAINKFHRALTPDLCQQIVTKVKGWASC